MLLTNRFPTGFMAKLMNRLYFFAVSLALLLSACAAPPAKPIASAGEHSWSGRLSIKIESDPVQQTTAGFTLQGNPNAGQLELFTPLGGKAAQVTWQGSPTSQAVLTTDQGRQTYPSLSIALAHITGTPIPIEALFGWLNADLAYEAKDGWKADLSRRSEGRIITSRAQPLPRIEIRVVLED
jgi:outer membrane lipoprotein LolB